MAHYRSIIIGKWLKADLASPSNRITWEKAPCCIRKATWLPKQMAKEVATVGIRAGFSGIH